MAVFQYKQMEQKEGMRTKVWGASRIDKSFTRLRSSISSEMHYCICREDQER